MDTMTPHWTKASLDDLAFRITSDFIAQLEVKIEKEQIERQELATRLGVTPGRVSQVLNDPGNPTARRMVQYARGLGMKVAIVAYDDCDPDNNQGPINSEVFTRCWLRMGKPRDLFSLDARQPIVPVYSSVRVSQKFYRPTIIRRPYDPMSQYMEVTSQAVFLHGGRNIAQEKTNVI